MKSSSRDAAAMVNFVEQVNNTLSNIGNGSSLVNYAAWGSASSVSPLSGFKITEYEGDTRAPFVVKEPLLAGSSNNNIINSRLRVRTIIKSKNYKAICLCQ
jgi:hypothetical protein